MRSLFARRLLPAVALSICGMMAAGPMDAQRAPTTRNAVTPPASMALPPDSSSPYFRVQVTGQGRPILLIPGLMSGGDVWRGTVDHLASRYQLHLITLAGFAGVPPAKSDRFLETMRDALLAYVTRAQLRTPLVIGHSLGAVIAYEMAIHQPDAVGGVIAIDGVPFYSALMDPNATAATSAPQANAMRAGFASMTPTQLAAQVRVGLGMQMRDSTNHPQAIRWAEASDPATVGQAMAEVLTTDLRPLVSQMRAPLLQIGAIGAIPPSPMRTAAAARYAAQVATVPSKDVEIAERAHHFVMLDEPAWFYATIDRFLARHYPPRRPQAPAPAP